MLLRSVDSVPLLIARERYYAFGLGLPLGCLDSARRWLLRVQVPRAACARTGLPLAWRIESGNRQETLFALPLLDA